jgi:hypothetical protein
MLSTIGRSVEVEIEYSRLYKSFATHPSRIKTNKGRLVTTYGITMRQDNDLVAFIANPPSLRDEPPTECNQAP